MLQNFKFFADKSPASSAASSSSSLFNMKNPFSGFLSSSNSNCQNSLELESYKSNQKRGFSSQGGGPYPLKASCQVGADGNVCAHGPEQAPSCHGTINFTQTSPDECSIEWDLKQCGLEGLHGFHIHEKADFSNGCLSAGPHYNPFNTLHGGPDDEERHVGDLGNVTMDKNGCSSGKLTDRMIKLEGEYSVVGRSVMIHADPDDLGRGDNSKAGEEGPPQNGFVSKITGNAGARIACGEIKMC